MSHPSDFLGVRTLTARVESRHSISSGNNTPLYRVELRTICDEDSGQQIWPRKTVSDGKKWNDVPTGSLVRFSSKLDFDRNNSVQLGRIGKVEVLDEGTRQWWQLW
jgi:hypothetical protein